MEATQGGKGEQVATTDPARAGDKRVDNSPGASGPPTEGDAHSGATTGATSDEPGVIQSACQEGVARSSGQAKEWAHADGGGASKGGFEEEVQAVALSSVTRNGTPPAPHCTVNEKVGARREACEMLIVDLRVCERVAPAGTCRASQLPPRANTREARPCDRRGIRRCL